MSGYRDYSTKAITRQQTASRLKAEGIETASDRMGEAEAQRKAALRITGARGYYRAGDKQQTASGNTGTETESKGGAMSATNITITGRLGSDPEVRYTNTGTAVAELSVAVNRGKKQPDGTWIDETTWWNVKAWSNLADDVMASGLSKGQLVICSGRVEIRDYETKDGRKGKAIELIADEIGSSIRWAAKNSGAPAAAQSAGYSDEPF